ncbi:MAG: hydrogenase [Desulfuromonadaceae bacterium]|nr:hydrogenase [Desulfuromonadaceae bacterium]
MVGLLVFGLVLIATSGVPGLAWRRGDSGERLFCGQVLAGVLGCLVPLAATAVSGGLRLELPWAVPAGWLVLELDALSATFIAPLLLVVACGALYGLRYWPQAEHAANGRKLRLFYGLISGAMLVLLLARNALLFLTAWEIMALSGYFLITTEDDKSDVRQAGFIYLIATHIGTLSLFGLFALLGQHCGSSDFPLTASLPAAGSGLLFGLALLGFGMKAGLMPLHIWLPGAHAAAPSHASALLSGVMIKTGIYGLVRFTSFFAHIPAWWGWTLLALGAVSGVLGVALAIAQHDIKRLLAYHSVENIGIIAMGLGLALLGRSAGQPALVVLGLSGCLLHVANHGLFKSLLFLSAGSVIHSVGSRDIDHGGGLLKRQRWTGLFFLGGAIAISGLPPFNGFISEWLIYLGGFGVLETPSSPLAFAMLSVPALALIGGLALACFVKVFGVVFLGEPRTDAAARAHESPPSMLWPMALLLLACGWIGLFPLSLRALLERAVSDWTGAPAVATLSADLAPLGLVAAIGWVLVVGVLLLGAWLHRKSATAPREVGTWGCGYLFPAPRMQYTASSFGDSLVRLFQFALRCERHGDRVEGLFPDKQEFSSHTPDLVLDRGLHPLFSAIAAFLGRLRRRLQNGIVACYLFYVVLTLTGLLVLVRL